MKNQRAPRECIDGLLLLDKGRGMTSNDALMRARRLFNARKAGHGGTLDPLASGLLPIAFGEATKFAGDALGADKTYLAELCLGITTDTGDAEGAELLRRPVDADVARVAAAAARFVGEIEQVPPMYSALKRDGRPLYEYARAGKTVERAARPVTIHAIDVLRVERVEGVAAGDPGSLRATLRVACSKGTYVRTLAEDIGEALGCGAHLSALRRERVGVTGIERAVTLEQLEAMAPEARGTLLQPLDFLLAALPRIELDDAHARRFLHGQRLRVAPSEAARPECVASEDPAPGLGAADGGGSGTEESQGAAPGGPASRSVDRRVRVYGRGELLGVATLDDGLLVPQRLVGTASTPNPGAAPAATGTQSSRNESLPDRT